MTTPNLGPLRWTAQLDVIPSHLSLKLLGDKITLPQSALEQLLQAATVTVASNEPQRGYTSTFDPFNPYSFEPERHARAQVFERQQHLPHPLTFRLVNPASGNVAYAGIREFSAQEGQVGISPFLREALGLEDIIRKKNEDISDEHKPTVKLTVHVCQLAKGTFVRFRPLEAGYDPQDWKSLLERHMRDTFTTLTKNEILNIPDGQKSYRFLIDKLAPENDAICIIDTDLEVEIEPLNEEQARESLKRKTAKAQSSQGIPNASSLGGELHIGKPQAGQVLRSEYVDYSLKSWDRSKPLEVELVDTESSGMLDLYVNLLTATQQAKPREDEYVFADTSGRPLKRVRIHPSNTGIEIAEAAYISVHGYCAGSSTTDSSTPLSFSIQISCTDSHDSGNAGKSKPTQEPLSSLGDIRCNNCRQWVPERTMMLHESFCFRNNILCPQCDEVFKKASVEWTDHWHCPHDNSHGNSPASRHKHDKLLHTAKICTRCGYEANNTPDLAHHRTTVCPGKLILCRFCHLLVPQQGPDDPSPTDPEVVFSTLTPHELVDGARTTECHVCGKIIRLRDMSTHLKHHDLERLARSPPRLCRNVNCGRTLDGVGSKGEIKKARSSTNDIGLCGTCYGPLYNSAYDPEAKALTKRLERRYISQIVSGCGRDWCRNEYCKTGRKHVMQSNETISMKDAMAMAKPILTHLMDLTRPLHLCTDEASQTRRLLAEMISSRGEEQGYDLTWTVIAMEAESGDLEKAQAWLRTWAPTRAETAQRES